MKPTTRAARARATELRAILRLRRTTAKERAAALTELDTLAPFIVPTVQQ